LVLLVFFGVLALVTAATDLKLARKRADWNRQYYLADAQAESVVALIDQVCRRAPDVPAERLLDLIVSRLARETSVTLLDAAVQGDSIRLSARILAAATSTQGVEMVLLIQTGAQDGPAILLVEAWTQWQPPFVYDEGPGGIWKG
jgi:hypothetical protein